MAGPYPLATEAATIDATGVSAPPFADIMQSFQARIQLIYGSDIVFDDSTQDQALVAFFTKLTNDSNQAVLNGYNAVRMAGAVGAQLDSLIKINGLERDITTNSTAPILVVGQAGTIIASGLVSDGTYQWALPATVTIPVGGAITETATCLTIGSISAAAGAINSIVNPQRGWQTAVSSANAAPGEPVETDPALFARQQASTEISSITTLAGVYAAIANLTGVLALKAYQNDTNSTDANGLPPHSMSMVVMGGDAVAIATAIAEKKDTGTFTYGSTHEIVTSTIGVPSTIGFFIPTQVPIDMQITIKAYTGYVSTTGTLILAQEAAYITELGIGGLGGYVLQNKLNSPANDTGTLTTTYNVLSILLRRGTNAFASTDVPIAFNEIPIPGNITLAVT